MAVSQKDKPTNDQSGVSGREVKEVRPDTKAAKIARFALGSVFGIAFLVGCFILLSAALKGPDTIKVDGVNIQPGLAPNQQLPDGRLKVGDTAPDFALEQLGGDPVQLSKLKGKTVLINFWASWCAPCRDEMPLIFELYKKYKNDPNVVVLMVNYREDGDTAKGYFKDNGGLTMPVLLDKDGKVAGGYRASAFPESYFIDKNGKVSEFKIGPVTQDELNAKFAAALNSK